jgi:hypothetical protein
MQNHISTAAKSFPLSEFDPCFLTSSISFLSADDKTVSVFLHVPSASEGQE